MSNFDDAFEAGRVRVEHETEVYDLKEALRNANAALTKAKVKSDAIAEAAFEGAKSAVLARKTPAQSKPFVHKGGKGKPEVALCHLTDWQGSKITVTYNSEIMRKRAHQFVDSMLAITAIQRTDHPVNDCVVLIGGDMIEGLFNYPAQLHEIDMTLFEQFVNVASILDEVIRRLSANFKSVRVVAEWGNHGRIGSKRSEVPKSDNADRMTYHLASVMTRDLSNVEWSIVADDIQQVEVGNYRALLIHGDEIGRNGSASPQALVQAANKWRSGAYGWEFRDVYIGHFHTHNEWAMANGLGAVYQTGSLESDNRYARDSMASSAIPSQRLHFVDPRKGRVTAQYKIWVD